MLWRRKATNYLKEKLELYLDPGTPVAVDLDSYTEGANSYVRKPVDFREFIDVIGQRGGQAVGSLLILLLVLFPGTEIALACHKRFMSDNPKGRIGLPEILVGLFPGAGGTTRYSRMASRVASGSHSPCCSKLFSPAYTSNQCTRRSPS